jgi:hypothetical protein
VCRTSTTSDAGSRGGSRACEACGGKGQPCCGAGDVTSRTCSGGLTCAASTGGGGGAATCQ